MKTTKKIITAVLVTTLFAACNSPEKKETNEEVKKDTTEAKPAVAEVVDNSTVIYRFKGAETYINKDYLKTISEQEKALLAYYCYFFNTSCADSKHCQLTEALGLGEQNSKEHQKLVLKWFTDDETVQLAKEGGRITPNGSKNMGWYEDLRIEKKGTLISVRYLSAWSTPTMEGKGKGTDEYEFEPTRIKIIGRLHEDVEAKQ